MKAKSEMLENGNLLVTIPMDLKNRGQREDNRLRRRGRRRGRAAGLPSGRDEGPRWQRLVDEGRVSGIHELAQAIGNDHSYVSRIMRLATLSPRIVEAIVDGRAMPPTLNVARARKAIPLLWNEQEREFRTE